MLVPGHGVVPFRARLELARERAHEVAPEGGRPEVAARQTDPVIGDFEPQIAVQALHRDPDRAGPAVDEGVLQGVGHELVHHQGHRRGLVGRHFDRFEIEVDSDVVAPARADKIGDEVARERPQRRSG
jgi:hypothetical protein